MHTYWSPAFLKFVVPALFMAPVQKYRNSARVTHNSMSLINELNITASGGQRELNISD